MVVVLSEKKQQQQQRQQQTGKDIFINADRDVEIMLTTQQSERDASQRFNTLI